MKIIKNNVTLVEGAGLSRIWQYTHSDMDFAIIGTQDKDTKEDRSREFLFDLAKISDRYAKKGKKITYRVLRGTYVYDNGEEAFEKSYLINNISKEDALTLMNLINQESIIWKDDKFFGFLDANGNPDGEFSKGNRNMGFDPEDVAQFGSRLDNKHNKGQGFTFKVEEMLAEKSRSSVRNLDGKNKVIRESLFTIKVNK